MRILIPGGSGLVGSAAIPYLLSQGHDIMVLTHRKTVKNNLNFPSNIKVFKLGEPLPTTDAIINLSGAKISSLPLTKGRINTLLNSRLQIINYLKEAYTESCNKIFFLQASASGIYANGDNKNIANSIYSKLCQRIESETFTSFKHCASLRLGVVVGSNGGLVSLLRFLPKIQFIGAHNYVPYIKNEDLARALNFILTHALTGNIDLVSDKFLQVNELLSLCQKDHFGPKFYIPKFVLKLDKRGALLLANQKILPQRLLDKGFNFT